MFKKWGGIVTVQYLPYNASDNKETETETESKRG